MWLRPTPEQRILAAERQDKNPNSMLNATRKAIRQRKSSKILSREGYVDFIDTEDSKVIAFIRSDKERKNKIALCFNFTDKPSKVRIPLPNNKFKMVTVQPLNTLQCDIDPLIKSNQNIR